MFSPLPQQQRRAEDMQAMETGGCQPVFGPSFGPGIEVARFGTCAHGGDNEKLLHTGCFGYSGSFKRVFQIDPLELFLRTGFLDRCAQAAEDGIHPNKLFLILPELLPVNTDLLQLGMVQLERTADEHAHLIPFSGEQFPGNRLAYKSCSSQHYRYPCHLDLSLYVAHMH
ncbi:hypothetical protein D3C75_957900 [compost metagenome]